MSGDECESCGGCGVLFDSGKQVERCDACKRFESDQKALEDVDRVYALAGNPNPAHQAAFGLHALYKALGSNRRYNRLVEECLDRIKYDLMEDGLVDDDLNPREG